MVDDAAQGLCSYEAISDIGMTVFAGPSFILAVVDVEQSNLIFTDQTVEAVYYTVKIMNNVIPCIVQVAGIHADTQFIIKFYFIEDGRQLFKVPPDLRAFSGHGFECDIAILAVGQHFINP